VITSSGQKNTRTKNCQNWILALGSYDRSHRRTPQGCARCARNPLAYVVRENAEVPPEADDPTTNYATRQEELIARAPHLETVTGNQQTTAVYSADSKKVWEIIAGMTRGTDCWTYVCPAQRTRDGRMAFRGLKDHYLGPNSVDTQSSTAERILQLTTYHGEKRR